MLITQLCKAIVISGIGLLLAACRPGLPAGETPVPEQVLFQDDYSNPASGWRQASLTGGQAIYADGVYQMRADGANSNVLALANRNFSDVRIEVDAIKTPGERNNRFGVVCRAMDGDNYYLFMVSSDGYYGIGKIIQNNPQLIGMDALLPSDKIPQGSGLTHLRVVCKGDRLALFVNGEKIHEVRDSSLETGDVGLVVGSYSPQGTEILFDNFKVTAP